MTLEKRVATVEELCRAAKAGQTALATASSERKDTLLRTIAAHLERDATSVLTENQRDVDAATTAGLSPALIDRLRLDDRRVHALASAVLDIVKLPDPVGEVEHSSIRPNGLRVGRMRIPLGVVAMIFEARPNIVVDASALCFKSGNAVVLKGGKEAAHTNAVLARIVHGALEASGFSPDVLALLTSRSDVDELLVQQDTVDLVIPRGGESLIRSVVAKSRIPVVQHYKGNCHLYVDDGADLAMARRIVLNAKAQRPSACNALETLLVHESVAAAFLPAAFAELQAARVELRVCPRTLAAVAGQTVAAALREATESDWHDEFLDLVLAVKVVKGYDDAVAHIRRYGSNHTEAIVTEDYGRATRFVNEIGSSCVLVNASTRFNDGGELGLGAEIGISTSKLHAYGPMGLRELTTQKWVVNGMGQVRS
ncbi:MAG: glutamate-5-semialdehyde dehydrogenase [Myxococcales bacterium]|nr:glutamate-5-semialdehyde dehydrogenase [Myxococcales bacterium]